MQLDSHHLINPVLNEITEVLHKVDEKQIEEAHLCFGLWQIRLDG